ncbi:hypothetical protein CASFOL_038075 [Castilleja foliolosa]|uniref:Alliin lyase n=1 Tax=Castilleja foliolosa TaxID=1961234 RepID=A0ABD3BKQ2_9LAMI
MAKTRMCSSSLWILGSIVLNFFLIMSHVYELKNKPKLSWSQVAAAEAEAVASISCSGHGRAYLDGLVNESGQPVCECNTCYEGHDCSRFLSDCAANADNGDPLFLEPFWMQHASSSAVVLSGWHRMSYTYPDHSYISAQLEQHIRKLHSVAKNAVAQGKYIVFGVGSTQLLSAAVFALTRNVSSPAKVVASAPYYPVYKSQTEFFETKRFDFQGDASSQIKNSSDNDSAQIVVEFVTSPNNPDGKLRKSVLDGPFVKNIYDHAYYWPHYTAIPAPVDEDMMIFTMSKLTGHAGTRFGWALVKDRQTYENMLYYVGLSEMGISRDTQLRALQILKTLLQGDGKQIFQFAYKMMSDRWDKLNDVISSSFNRFTIQEISPQFCNFFEQIRGPSPAYAWLRCEREEDKNCTSVIREANILGRNGSLFSSEDRYVRLSLIRSQDEFDLLLQRLVQLIVLSKVNNSAFQANDQ